MPPPTATNSRPPRALIFFALLLITLFLGRSIAAFVIEYHWWTEIGQFPTFENLIIYRYLPLIAATLLAFVVLWVAHARGLKFAGTGLRQFPIYAAGSTLVLFLLSLVIARSSLDPWKIVSYFGSQRAGAPPDVWRDPIFGKSLPFYFFDLPLYTDLIGYIIAVAFVAMLVYWAAARFFSIAQLMRDRDGEPLVLDPRDLFGPALEAKLFRTLLAIVLLASAARVALHRYSYLSDDHGFLVGIDWVADHVRIPLLWVTVAAFVLSALLFLAGRYKLALRPLFLLILPLIIPPIVSAVYVRPNELSLQRPYIEHHIRSTRAAWGLDRRLTEVQHPGKLEAPINANQNSAILDNVRLWDWRAFNDTVTQIQALRQYYAFSDTDVDRYTLGGNLRQVMLSARELDISQLPDAQGNWINRHFIYTHGYGLVMGEASRITPNGQPVLMIQDAPPTVKTPGLQITRPEIYFGEVTHEPVFVRSNQPEFNYPAGAENVQTRYEGRGGIPIGNYGMRIAAAVLYADRNMLLTQLLTPESRMLIRRNVRERIQHVAGFIQWDGDPYLVLTEEGRLVWMIDGYTSSDSHPYSRGLQLRTTGRVNYLRNSVKAVVDAYDGSLAFYVFEPNDPVIRAFDAMFPELLQPASAMPAGIRAHARYPEVLFSTQAEIYRTFHMTEAEAFYNREDLWDVAKQVYAQTKNPEPTPPTFVVATVPGGTRPEFLLVQPFTPRNKDNLIGLMMARSDGEHLGELVILHLSKQSLIYGPLQVEARIDSDQVISKDLSLWNQQGSQVLRGQILVLPIEDTFIYVKPIYIQSAQAKMPQLRKVVVAMGNTLVYKDTYEEAIAELAGSPGQPQQAAPTGQTDVQTQTSGTAPAAEQPAQAAPQGVQQGTPAQDPRVETARNHLRRYRELSAQGRWAEAGRELEALERLIGR